jgi:raffinose/stachyose/melibiose transport system permease protein
MASTTTTGPSARVAARTEPGAGVQLRSALARASRWVVLLFVAATIVVPIAYAFVGGFRTTGAIRNNPAGFPDPWVLDNYADALTGGMFWQQLANSVLIAGIAVAVVVTVSAMAAYVFARFAFPGREALFTLFALGLLFPAAVAILPLYILLRTLGLLDNPLGVALPQAAFGIPLTIVILRPFFRSIPAELEDAARIDGCGMFGFFWRVLLPLSRPALATVAILALVGSWNAFLLPLLILGGTEQWTLPLGVMNFSSQYSQDVARILAYTSLSMIPALLFYLVAERQLIGGLTSGAVKG